MNCNNFEFNQRSLRHLKKLKTVTHALWMIVGNCFVGFWKPIRIKLSKNNLSADQSKVTHNRSQNILNPKLDIKLSLIA